MARMRILIDYIAFLKARRKWWILPIALVLIVLGLLMVLTEGSSLAPFIYALF
jgi:hypothetical protein